MWQLWLCLFGALLLGAVLGWLLRGNCKKKLATLIDDWSQRFGIVEKERNLFALKIQDQDRLKSENKSLLGRLNSMEIGANLASDVLKENKERLDNAEYSLSEMGMQLEQRSTDIFLLKNKLKESVSSSSVIENSASNSVLTDLKKKKIALKKLNEKYQSIKEDKKMIRDQLTKKEEKNQKMSEKVTKAKESLSVAEALNNAYEKSNADVILQLDENNKNNQSLTDEVKGLSEKLEGVNKQSAEDKNKLEKMTTLYNNNVEDSRVFKSKIIASGNDLRVELKNKEAEYEGLEKEIESAKKEAKENTVQVVEMQKHIKLQEKHHQVLVTSEQQLQMAVLSAEELVYQHEKEIEKQKVKVTVLHDDLCIKKEKEQENIDEINLMHGLLSAHEKGNSDLSAKENQLKKELAVKKTLMRDHEKKALVYESNIQLLKEDVDRAKKREDDALGELEMIQALLKVQEEEGEKTLENEQILQQALSQAEESCSLYKKTVEKYKAKVKTVDDNLQSSLKKEQENADEISMMQNLLVAHEKGNHDLSEKEDQLQKELAVMMALTRDHEKKASVYEGNIQSLKENVDTSKAREEEVLGELEMIQALVKAQEEGKKEALDNDQILQHALFQAEELCSGYEKTIEKYKDELKAVEDNLQSSLKKEQQNADEVEMMQGLLAAHEEGKHAFFEKEGKLQKELSMMEVLNSGHKNKISECTKKLELLVKEFQSIQKREKLLQAEAEVVQPLLSKEEKGKQDTANDKQQLKDFLPSPDAKETKNSDRKDVTQIENMLFTENSNNVKTPISNNIEEVDGIGKGLGKRFRKIGIKTTRELLEKCQHNDDVKKIAKIVNESEKTVKTWCLMADLLRVEGIDGKYAELLYLSGIHSTEELAASNVSKIKNKMKNVVNNQYQHHTKKVPTKKLTAKWISSAKKLLS
ncbi:MAG: DUF4332 domain-containing protein [Cocleimonas sp.]|nr:DUF4332 domain-containing protein [Cocleimonas sp.]